MSKLPKVIKGKEILKVLVKHGYEIKRQRGSEDFGAGRDGVELCAPAFGLSNQVFQPCKPLQAS